MEIIRYKKKYKSSWDNFVENSNKNFFFFKRDYLEYKNKFKDYSLIIFSKKKIIALFPSTYLKNEIISHSNTTYGGIITNKRINYDILSEIIKLIFSYYKNHNFKKILYKLVPSNFNNNFSAEEEHILFNQKKIKIISKLNTYIDSNNNPKFSVIVKRHLKKNKNLNFKISGKNFDKFYIILKKILKKKYQTNPTHNFNEIVFLKNKFRNNIFFYSISFKNKVVGGYLLYKYNNSIFNLQYSCFSEIGQKVFAQDYLTNFLINNLQMKILSLGKSNDPSSNNINLGLLRKKKSYGGKCVSEKIFEIKF